MLGKNALISKYRKFFAILMLFIMFLSFLTPISNAEEITPPLVMQEITPEVVQEVTPEVTPEVTLEVTSVVTPSGITIELSNDKMTIQPENSMQLTVVVKENNVVLDNPTVTWSSSDIAITTVDENGLVKAIGVGTATVTATCNGVEVKCDVVVEEATVTKIELDYSSVKIVVGANKTVLATVYNQLDEIMTGQTVTWSSTNPEVATVDETGQVTAVSVGITTITVACSGISVTCEVEVFDGYSTNVVIFTGSTSLVAPLVQAYHNLTEKRDPPYQFGLSVFSDADFDSNPAKVQQAVQNADVVLVQMISDTRTEAFRTILSDSWGAQWKNRKAPAIYTTGCSDGFPINIVKDLSIQVNINTDDLTVLTKYISASGTDNCERLLLFLASKYGEEDVTTAEDLTPIENRGTFAYHPEAAGNCTFSTPEEYYDWYQSRADYDPSAPWVGIMDYDSSYTNSDYDLMVELVKSLENKGNNVVLIFTPSSKKFDSARSYFYRDLDGDGQKEPAIDTFICPMGFAFDSTNVQNTIDLFTEMNVPVLSPIYAKDLETWENDLAGTSSDLYWNVAMPEMDGRIEPVLMGGIKTLNIDEATGAMITKKVALPDRIERVAGRAASWAKLHKMENQDKKVAVLYYNYDGGKDGIGASYLNVPRSMTEILKALEGNDYTVNEDGSLSTDGEITEEKVFNEMFSKGRNIGGWAPGELETFAAQDGIIKISLDKYLSWYNQLPDELREAVEKDWGPAPGKVMVQDGEIIIPGVINGNVFFGPQPMRGWGEDVSKTTHSPTLPPSHQYLAFYWWLQDEFKADASIHLGTHGTTEWLPGKSIGLSAEDWPDIVQGDMPNIYPYIVNNPGEGTQAKRRGYAVLIDHLTSALVNTELYGNLLELHTLANEYDTAVANSISAEDLEKIRVKVRLLVVNEGVGEKVGVSADDLDNDFDSSLEKCKKYLDDLEADVTTLGLHTFGVAPEGDAFEGMIKAIVNFDPANRGALEAEIRANLENTTQEMDMILLALNAGYISPNIGNDPVRDPSVMPTGKNMVSFDPRKVPDKTSWEIGKKCADDLLASYYEEHGTYPESVGVVLWAVETMRTQGESVAMIMRLIGVEPVWDATEKVKSYKIIPTQDLGRPRIDVVVTASSLFRDTFSNVMTLLDKAIRELAINSDDGQNNYIKKHYDTLKGEYLSQGKSVDDAEFLAASRVYSEAPGSAGNGMAEKIGATESWETSEDLVDTYLSRASYIYGTDKNGTAVYGQAAKDTFVDMLENVQMTVLLIDSTYGALDNDDVAQYLGGLTLAAKWASGEDVDAYIANTRLGLDNLKVQTLREFVSQELDSRLLNPKFVEAMLAEGYAGSETLAKWIGNAFMIAATTGAISNNDWHDLAATYIFNDAVRAQLDPYALQSMIGYQLEAARKGMWEASSEDLTELSNVYMQTMVDYGVVCCHHTCKNIVMNEWLAQFSTLDDSVRNQFQETLVDATQKNVTIAMLDKTNQTTTDNSSSSDIVDESTKPLDTVIDDQAELKNSQQPQQTATQEQTASQENTQAEAIVQTASSENTQAEVTAQIASQGNTQKEATAQTPTAVAAAGNLPAASGEQVKPETKDAQEQNTAGEQEGKTQEYKAYEISEEGKQNKASGVSMWALLGVGGAMAAIAFGIMKGKIMSRY
jgi:cobaltochelatase CobN